MELVEANKLYRCVVNEGFDIVYDKKTNNVSGPWTTLDHLYPKEFNALLKSFECVETPIEGMLFWELFQVLCRMCTTYFCTPDSFINDTVEYESHLAVATNRKEFFEKFGTVVLVCPQVKVNPYRLDFMLTVFKPDGRYDLAIECDGKEWHHSNIEQVNKDQKRDRQLLMRGVCTTRFTGTKLYRDAKKCAKETAQLIHHLQNQEMYKVG